ncbi:MAG: PAS domain-containing protein [Betaproteobacteria bacterium]
MGELVRRFDWSATPLGPMDGWPVSLKSTVAALLNSRNPMFLWWGPELIQVYNDAYMPSFGVGKHPAALGQRGKDCWPEIWPIIGPQIEGVIQRGEATWHEDALVPIFRNGRIEEVYWTYGYSPVFDDNGRIAGTLVVCTETTGRVLATRREQEVRKAAEDERSRLRQFFEQAPAAICIHRGDDLVFDFANDQYHKLTGRKDLVGHPLLVAMPELAGQGLDDLLRKVMATGEPFVGREVPILLDPKASGAPEEHFYTFIYSPLRATSDAVDAVVTLAFDVTDQVLARRKAEGLLVLLRESERQFHEMAESLPQLAWGARPDGYIDWYNRRWYEYTGTTLEDVAGWGWKSVHDPALIDEVEATWTASIVEGKPFEMQFPLRSRDGRFRWHLTRALPLRDESGRIVRWFGTNTDIDDSRRAEEERKVLLASEHAARVSAEIASRAKDDFLATASHELRTPLNAIMGWATLLQTGKLEQSDYLRAVDSISRNARSQVRLIEDILDGSRIITGRLHLEIRPLDMTTLVHAALDSVRSAAEAKNIELTVVVEPDAARIVGDPDRLQQVVWNLANNAIKFTPKGGATAVSLKRVGTDIQLRVKDTGQGIASDFLPYVFDRFRQAEGSTTRRHGGLGLGLALVKHLVEAHGGTVHAASEGEGRGATFTVMLPVQAVFEDVREVARPAPSTTGVVATASRATLHGVTVLVVDDEMDARDLVATALRASGAEVTTASSAAQALELLAKTAFMVMVSDVGMPETDGYELIRHIRTRIGERGAHLPAVALTAYSREEDRRMATEAGFQTHVAKPVDPAELVRIVAGLVSESERTGVASQEASLQRADTLSKFEKLLNSRGVHEALRFLNSRTSHRFTGLYRFDPPLLRNVLLLDADAPELLTGSDAPLEETYCSIVGATEHPFTTEDTRRDGRLRTHPARETVQSYCGVLLRNEDGKPFGTLCHFDLVPCDIPVREMSLMEAAAPMIVRALITGDRRK